MRKTIKRHLIPILALISLGVVIFHPLLPDLAHRIAGSTGGGNTKDAFQNIWNIWWAQKNCLGLCGNMWQTNFQFFPVGTSLLFETWAYPSLYMFTPLMFLGLSAVTAYNLAIIFAVITSLLSSYALVYYLTKRRSAAFIGALIYGLSPFIIGHVLDGQLNLTNIQFFPLFLLFLLKSTDEKGLRYQILTAVTLVLLGLNDYVFLIIAFMSWVIYMIYCVAARKNKLGMVLKKNFIILSIFLVSFCLFSYKNLKDFKQFALKGQTKWDANYSSANLAAFTTPPPYTLGGGRYFPDSYKNINGIFSDKTVYLGLTPLLLSILGILYLRGKKELWLWLSLGGTAFLFSLGPSLHYFEKIFSLWLPFRFLEILPLANIIRAPSRFAVILYLCIAVLSGYGIMLVAERAKSNIFRVILVITFSILVLVEYCPFNLPETDLYMPVGYREIIKDKEDFAIIESPAMWMSGLKNESRYFPAETLYYQTIHQKKMANGYVTRMPVDLANAYTETPILRFIVDQSNNNTPSEEMTPILERYQDYYIKNILSDNPYKYLVLINDSRWLRLNKKVKETLSEKIAPYYRDNEVEIYTFKK